MLDSINSQKEMPRGRQFSYKDGKRNQKEENCRKEERNPKERLSNDTKTCKSKDDATYSYYARTPYSWREGTSNLELQTYNGAGSHKFPISSTSTSAFFMVFHDAQNWIYKVSRKRQQPTWRVYSLTAQANIFQSCWFDCSWLADISIRGPITKK